jgi:ferrous iron transport protein A
MLLADLPDGAHATVARVGTEASELDAGLLRRLGELGFLPGEPVLALRRGPGGREPLAVMVGETMLALRWVEARCIEVQPA